MVELPDHEKVAVDKASPTPLLSQSMVRIPPKNAVPVFAYLILAQPVCALFDHDSSLKRGPRDCRHTRIRREMSSISLLGVDGILNRFDGLDLKIRYLVLKNRRHITFPFHIQPYARFPARNLELVADDTAVLFQGLEFVL